MTHRFNAIVFMLLIGCGTEWQALPDQLKTLEEPDPCEVATRAVVEDPHRPLDGFLHLPAELVDSALGEWTGEVQWRDGSRSAALFDADALTNDILVSWPVSDACEPWLELDLAASLVAGDPLDEQFAATLTLGDDGRGRFGWAIPASELAGSLSPEMDGMAEPALEVEALLGPSTWEGSLRWVDGEAQSEEVGAFLFE